MDAYTAKHWVCIYVGRKPHVKSHNRAAIKTGQHKLQMLNMGEWRAKRAHECTTSYCCWQTTETTTTLLYQLSLQTNDCGSLPSSHYVQYTTIVTSHNTLLDLLDVRVHLQFKHSHCHGRWGPTWTGQWPAGPHQHGLAELLGGSWSLHHCQSCGAATPSWGPGSGWCWHGHPLQLGAGH